MIWIVLAGAGLYALLRALASGSPGRVGRAVVRRAAYRGIRRLL